MADNTLHPQRPKGLARCLLFGLYVTLLTSDSQVAAARQMFSFDDSSAAATRSAYCDERLKAAWPDMNNVQQEYFPAPAEPFPSSSVNEEGTVAPTLMLYSPLCPKLLNLIESGTLYKLMTKDFSSQTGCGITSAKQHKDEKTSIWNDSIEKIWVKTGATVFFDFHVSFILYKKIKNDDMLL
jgi:hypothetical protein